MIPHEGQRLYSDFQLLKCRGILFGSLITCPTLDPNSGMCLPQCFKFLDDSDALWVMGLASPDVRLGILKKVMEGSCAFHPDVARHRAQQGRAKQLDQRMGKRLG